MILFQNGNWIHLCWDGKRQKSRFEMVAGPGQTGWGCEQGDYHREEPHQAGNPVHQDEWTHRWRVRKKVGWDQGLLQGTPDAGIRAAKLISCPWTSAVNALSDLFPMKSGIGWDSTLNKKSSILELNAALRKEGVKLPTGWEARCRVLSTSCLCLIKDFVL